VAKIQGQSVSATAPTSAGQVLRYDGASAYIPAFLSLADIRSTVTPANAMFPGSSCTAAQTLTWSSLTDTMSCTAIAIPSTQVSGLGTLATKSAATLSSADVTGTLPVANGGTGQTSFIDGQLLIGNSTGNTLTKATLTAGTGVKITNGSGSVTIAADSNQPSEYDPSCPAGYVSVPGNPTYGGSGFCVMKYEAKTGSNVVAATTAAAGNPVVSINRDNARTSCRLIGPGYDLISNAQWQTIARNIARTASNWSTGTIASGELNRGHSDSDPNNSLAADASDVNACIGTNQTCSDTVWDSQRRTHTLSNGEVIWDFAGNVWEWVTDNNSAVAGADGYVSSLPTNDKRQRRYGADPATLCATPGASPYCGMGHAWANYSAGAVLRGGRWSNGIGAGVFASGLTVSAAYTAADVGFRCAFQP
jgi:formylglycine-generating enzyme required for sulfatase activity